MAEAKARLGKLPCPECGEIVPLRQNETGTLSIACHECDFSGFAKNGSECHKRWLGKLTAKVADPEAYDKPKVTAEKKPNGAAFSLESL